MADQAMVAVQRTAVGYRHKAFWGIATFCHLEGNIAAVVNNLRVDLGQLLSQTVGRSVVECCKFIDDG